MRYGEPIEAIGEEIAAGKAQLNAQIAESSEVVRMAMLRALNASGGNTKGVTVADVSPKGVMLKADSAKTVSYFSIPAPEVNPQRFNACIDRLIAYLQVENDELMIQLGVERLDQNKASFDARHQAQLKKIDKQIAEMRADESASTLSKIFKWIGMGIAIAAAAVAATIATVMTYGAGSMSYGAVALLVSAAVGLCSATVMGLDAGGVLEELKESKTKEYMQQGMSRAEASKAASKIVMGISLGSAILNAIVQIVAAVLSAGATSAKAAEAIKEVVEAAKLTQETIKTIQQVSQGAIAGLQGLQAVGSGLADKARAMTAYNLAVAEADVKHADALLKEAKEFLNQNVEEIQALTERMEGHFRAYRAVVASKAATLLHLAENI